MQQYSNVHGDFTATPNAGTKTITFSAFANNVISGDLGLKNFIRGEVYEIFAGGGYAKIPLTNIAFSSDVLTINSMTAPFKAGDTVAVYIEGRDKGFDEAADKYKTDGGGGGVTSDTNMIEVGGEAIELGQAIEDESLPVVLPATQVAALTPPAAITNYANETGGNLAAVAASTGAAADAAGTVGAAGTVQAKLRLLTTLIDAIKTAAEVMDDWDESDRAKVNPIVGQAGVDGGAGTVSAKTLRTTMATDSPLPTGTNKLGGIEIRGAGSSTAAEVMTDGADGVSNATNELVVSSHTYGYNGTTWDRMRGTILNGLLVNTSGTPAGSFFMSSALAASGVVKAAAGTLLACNGRLDMNADSGQYFLQFYDAAAVPADGAVTILRTETIEHVQGFSTEINFEFPRGRAAASGITFALSTTEFTKTIAVGEDYLSLQVEYR